MEENTLQLAAPMLLTGSGSQNEIPVRRTIEGNTFSKHHGYFQLLAEVLVIFRKSS
ncbi:MAG: hypothetical protein ACMX3H_19155 [Sodalis sp. (in: enterobacteria)]